MYVCYSVKVLEWVDYNTPVKLTLQYNCDYFTKLKQNNFVTKTIYLRLPLLTALRFTYLCRQCSHVKIIMMT